MKKTDLKQPIVTTSILEQPPGRKNKILLIDDDELLAPPLAEYFEKFSLKLHNEIHPKKGLSRLTMEQFDLVILDIMLPDIDGFEVCKSIRKTSDIPIIMLTARGEVLDRIIGLEIGADDYLPKPFEPRELIARIQNILKRQNRSTQEAQLLEYSELRVNLQAQEVHYKNSLIEFTSQEYQLFNLLISSPGRVYHRDEILNHLKGIDVEIFSRAVDISVSRVRNKLKPLNCIKTHRGAGYSFVMPS